jgi:hypothetical protein
MKCRPTARSEATATRHIFVPEGLYILSCTGAMQSFRELLF